MTVDGERRACRNLVIGRCRDEEPVATTHFFVEQANRILFVVVGPEGIGTDKLCETVSLVRGSAFDAAHFVENYGYAERCRLPGCFASGHAAADNVNGFDAHPA